MTIAGADAHARLDESCAVDVAVACLEARLIEAIRFQGAQAYNVSARASFGTKQPLVDDGEARTEREALGEELFAALARHALALLLAFNLFAGST